MNTWKYHRNASKKDEVVTPERVAWEATYTDGSSIKQFGDDQVFHQIKEIDQSRLAEFRVLLFHPNIILKRLLWKPEYRLLYFYRNRISGFGSQNETFTRLYCFGYRIGNESTVFIVTPDNKIVVSREVDCCGY